MKTLIFQPNQYHDFAPVDFGRQDCKPEYSYGPHIRNHYLIHYIRSGCGTFQNPKGTHSVSSGSAFLIRPGELCTYTADSKNPWQYIWIGFTGNMAKAFDQQPDVFKGDKLLFEEMEQAFHFSSCQAAFLSGMLFKLYCTLFDKKERPDYVNQVIGYINIHYSKHLRIEHIADYLAVDRKYLSRIFKEQTGKTIQQILIQKRMEESEKLLNQGFHVAETATMVGYADSFTFSKAFKQHFGLPPKTYQSKIGRRIGS